MDKILIIRFSSIGDIVLTTPIVRAIKEQKTDVEIHYLTKVSFQAVVESNPHIDKVISFKKSTNEVLSQLINEQYSFIIDLHNNIRSRILKFKLRKPSSAFPKLNFEKFILVNFKKNLLPDVHIVHRYFKTVQSVGVNDDHKGLEYYLSDKDIVPKSDLPSTHQSRYIAIVIGGAHETKQLPKNKLIDLLRNIEFPIILLGGPLEKEMGEELSSLYPETVYNAAGKFTLNQSVYLVKNAFKVISGDTGLMHIAAAFNKDIISIWGNTVPEFGMYPYNPDGENNIDIVQVPGLKCRPCSQIGYSKCPKGHFDCMEKQDIGRIIALIEEKII